MTDNVNETYLSVSASVGRMGPASAIEAGIGADISYSTAPFSRSQGQGQGRVAPSNDYCTYVWQAIGLASALAMSPFILYGIWKASSFLCCHLRAFGWAWIICFIVSLCIAIYMENSGSNARQDYSQSQSNQVIQTDNEAMMDLLQASRGHVPYPHINAVGPAQSVAPSKAQLPARPQTQAPPPKSKQQSAAQMNAAQGGGNTIADCPTVGGAQLVTPVGRVFNEESTTVTEIEAIE